ncbi:SDR family oxidoreductase [uncultured Phenylobacterium sp.]|uniref:SDR family oxidoreductase n=1 Tax=uncultured Phenylobacterium sp. TaxID=349273 RepID=UPI0025DFB9AD|nr:SDR family oxidoreductase [uncultured Phenylobacterium sp.]
MSLSGNRVLVVGGGSGIGFAVAQAARAAGAVVTIASTSAERIAEAADRLSVQGAVIDVTDEAAVEAFFAAADGFEHIVTTAGDWGGPRRGPLADVDLAAAEGLFRVRFWGAVALAKHGAKVLTPGGSITLTDGMIAHRPTKGSAISTAMAGAVEHLTRGLAVELAPIRVNCVCPGLIRTGVWDRIPEERREAQFTEMTKGQLVPRIGEPGEAAEAYLYLMRGGYTTGQVLFVEGGSALGA